MNSSIAENLSRVRAQIEVACQVAGRASHSVSLLAVSKTWGPEAVRAAHAAGQSAFGENYIQEAVDKISVLKDLPLEWHCIGPIQSNKTRWVAEYFDWVHSVDRLKIAQRLSELDIAPAQCLYVGDDERDIVAGLAAGMGTVAAGYGYLGKAAEASSWGAHALINSPDALLQLLDKA
jgi:hypothetical protein